MTLDPHKLLRRQFPPVEHRYEARDTMLYALGVGLGADPLDGEALRFVYEKELRVLPSMAAVLASPGFWLREPDTGVDWVRVLHGEQDMEFHAPLPAAGTIRAQTRVTAVVDKGAGKGALILTERVGHDAASGAKLFTVRQVTFARGDGGCGNAGDAGAAAPAPPLPERKPDAVCDLPTLPQAALIYRLSGDYNPLHADPAVAAAAGYPRPILHGLCTLGVAGHALLRTCCGYDPARLRSLRVRFTAPIFPGETLRTEIWRAGTAVSFRARVLERDVRVLDQGHARLAG
jgi:acyl dehydratase